MSYLLRVIPKSNYTSLRLMPKLIQFTAIKDFSIKCKCLKLANRPSNSSFLYITIRHRASYYQDKGIKKAIRKILIRYPRSPVIIAISLLLIVFFWPVVNYSKIYLALSKEEFIDYRNKHNAVVYERVKTGTNIFFPFFTKNIATNQDEETQKVYARSDLPPARTSIY